MPLVQSINGAHQQFVALQHLCLVMPDKLSFDAVRKIAPDSTGHLEALAAALPGTLELHTVSDLLADGAYDNIVKGATYV